MNQRAAPSAGRTLEERRGGAADEDDGALRHLRVLHAARADAVGSHVAHAQRHAPRATHAVTVLVRPGPAVTAATPTTPDVRATASAAKTAAAWRVRARA
jgi:hypothetical protein